MTKIISVTGKGGVGKSTFSALIIKYLTEKLNKVILAVDADPNSTLGDMLGVKIDNTIGNLREDLLKEKDNLPAGVSKQEHVNYQIQSALTEESKFDLITMGRSEGPGCYCYINSILRNFIDNISTKYEYVIIDNEAGMEHLSRRTTMKMDKLFIVSEPSLIGVKTAGRILELAKEMNITIDAYELIINRSRNGISDKLKDFISKSEFQQYRVLPLEPDVEDLMLEDRSLLELKDGTNLFQEIISIGKDL